MNQRAPYQPGDHLQALVATPGAGTTLLKAATVTAITRDGVRPTYPWRVQYRDGDDLRTVAVDDTGRDACGYVKASHTDLPHDLAQTTDGQRAITIAQRVSAHGVPGALATCTGGNCIAVAITWPTGDDRVLASVLTSTDGTPSVLIAAYDAGNHTDMPDYEKTTNNVEQAARIIAHLATI